MGAPCQGICDGFALNSWPALGHPFCKSLDGIFDLERLTIIRRTVIKRHRKDVCVAMWQRDRVTIEFHRSIPIPNIENGERVTVEIQRLKHILGVSGSDVPYLGNRGWTIGRRGSSMTPRYLIVPLNH